MESRDRPVIEVTREAMDRAVSDVEDICDCPTERAKCVVELILESLNVSVSFCD
jgi:hypothetical protein